MANSVFLRFDELSFALKHSLTSTLELVTLMLQPLNSYDDLPPSHPLLRAPSPSPTASSKLFSVYPALNYDISPGLST